MPCPTFADRNAHVDCKCLNQPAHACSLNSHETLCCLSFIRTDRKGGASMSAMLSKVVEQSTTRHTNYWFAILIWVAVLVASLVAVTASFANVVIGETRKVELATAGRCQRSVNLRAEYRRPTDDSVSRRTTLTRPRRPLSARSSTSIPACRRRICCPAPPATARASAGATASRPGVGHTDEACSPAARRRSSTPPTGRSSCGTAAPTRSRSRRSGRSRPMSR